MPQSPLLATIARKLAGTFAPGILDQQGGLWVADRHGKYYNGVYGTPTGSPSGQKAGSTFRCANQSSATISNGLTTTYTGLCLSNPAGNSLNFALKKIGCVITNAPSGQIGLGLIAGWASAGITVHTTPQNTNIVNAYIGAAATGSPPVAGPAPSANVDSACTLVGTPTWIDWLQGNGAANSCTSFFLDADDDIIIPPGGYVAFGATASQGGAFASFLWEELPP